jgi:tRNA A37 threonylcarbamoyladenosine dehydratase
MLGPFSRTGLLIGDTALNKLSESKVAVFGIGGVGSYAAEGLARSGVGTIILVDDDNICLTNINRQIHATVKTVGKSKVLSMKDRIKEINPDCEVIAYSKLYTSESADELLSGDYTYVIDAIDMVTSKIDLIVRCKKMGIPIISCMGAGNKLDPTKFEVADIYETSICPLAKVMRYELRKRDVKSLKVVYSKEVPIKPEDEKEFSCKYNCICPPGTKRKCSLRHQVPGSISFVPSVAGLIIAGEVIKDIIGVNNK